MAKNFYNGLNTPLCNADLLSIERNKLSNERTLLSYSRTFLSFAVAGVSLIQFFQQNQIFVVFGYALIPAGVVIMAIGFYRYFRTKRLINEIQHRFMDEDEDDPE